ncbi:MAG: hypothetical protein HYV68_01030 [Candidatus Taylorbacteria bacterium]|nr:hypothetical protein [Candidatus Taylorbacteria bacterium]
MKREIEEDLGINISDCSLFTHYEFYGSVKDVFMLAVQKDFGQRIVVGEGQYGKFFSEAEVVSETNIYHEDRVIPANFFGKMKYDKPHL